MKCIHIKIVKGELVFNNTNDAKKINELINEWHNAIIQYANMYAKIERFIEIQTKLPENLKKTAKEYAEQLVKQNGKHCIFADFQKANEIQNNIKQKIKNAENIVSKKAIKHLENKKIVAIKNNFIRLERSYVRSNDEFKTVIITTLEKYKTINAWFRCKRKQLLIEALNSPKINNKVKVKYNVKAIIYEDLRNNFKNKSKDFNFKIRRWFYRKILNYLINSANWNGISTIYVDPYDTSKICPKCNNELEKDENFNDLHHFECKKMWI